MEAYRAEVAFDGERVMPGGALVLVRDGVIIGVQPAAAAVPDGCPMTWLPGTTLLPGLIDAHSHLCGNDGPDALDRLPSLSADDLDRTVEAALAAQLAAGVTAVRDLGDHRWAVVDRHRDRPTGPTVVAAGPPITSPGGHCATMGGEASGIDGLRRAVRERAERGADLVKIMASGGVMTPGTDIRACQFSLEELCAAVEEAHRLGLPVTAHAHALTAVEQCAAAGVDGIEHCSFLTGQGIRTPPRLAAAIAAAGITVCPTLGHDLEAMASLPASLLALAARVGVTLEQRLAQVGELQAAGVSFVSGVDSGINPVKRHGLLPTAVVEMVAAGVPPVTALASATGGAARACGLADRTGRLRAGLQADLLLVDGDPTTDITAVRDTRLVVCRGRRAPLLTR
ncbi:amidohydrolase family protein [Actinoplanes sp. NPDC049599]|uniref:amidohydrolase family protein n=1 Tax=Actinoplanes sp. NPDC049599 TaxID=3363903 RepID=UPI0037B93AFE